MNKIVILTVVHPLFDGRIFHRQAKTLVRAGYSVTLIANSAKEDTVDGIKIIPSSKSKNRLIRMSIGAWRILALAIRQKATVYHFHDPELIPLGLILKLLGKKVIYDVHEDYACQIFSKDYLGNKTVKKIISQVVSIFETIGDYFFDAIVGATPAITAKFRNAKRITLRNVSTISSIGKIDFAAIPKNSPIAIYAGTLSSIRGIEEIIQAIGLLNGRVELWLLGEWENEIFRKKCMQIKGWEYTKYLGMVPYGEHLRYMKAADIALINFYPLSNHTESLPNKIFEYFTCSLPVIASRLEYWQDLFGDCIIFVNPYSSKDLSEKIAYLIDNPDVAKKLGEKGYGLVQRKYNWESESKKLLNLYDELIEK